MLQYKTIVLMYCDSVAQHDVPLCLTFQIQMRLEEKMWWLNFKTTQFMQPVSALFPVDSTTCPRLEIIWQTWQIQPWGDVSTNILNCSPLSMNFQRPAMISGRGASISLVGFSGWPRASNNRTSDIRHLSSISTRRYRQTYAPAHTRCSSPAVHG